MNFHLHNMLVQGALLAGLVLLALYAVFGLFTDASGKVLLLDIDCFTIPDRLKVGRQDLMNTIRDKGVSAILLVYMFLCMLLWNTTCQRNRSKL